MHGTKIKKRHLIWIAGADMGYARLCPAVTRWLPRAGSNLEPSNSSFARKEITTARDKISNPAIARKSQKRLGIQNRKLVIGRWICGKRFQDLTLPPNSPEPLSIGLCTLTPRCRRERNTESMDGNEIRELQLSKDQSMSFVHNRI